MRFELEGISNFLRNSGKDCGWMKDGENMVGDREVEGTAGHTISKKKKKKRRRCNWNVKKVKDF